MSEKESGTHVGHFPCPSCASSDNLSVYLKTDENGVDYYDGSCWTPGCEHKFWTNNELVEAGVISGEFTVDKAKLKEPKKPITKQEYEELCNRTNFSGKMKDGTQYRGLADWVLKFYGHRVERNSDGSIKAVYYPETKDNKPMGFKSRHLPKIFGKGNIGKTGITNDLSGMHKFPNGGKYVVIVGGEEDKCAAQQMFRDYQIKRNQEDYDHYAVVSPTTGEGGAAKQCAANYDWLDTFDNIVVCMDNDKAGIEAIEELVKVLPKDKVKIMSLSGKDPNQMLLDGKHKQFISNFWDAKPLIEDVVKTSKQADEEIEIELSRPKIPLPPFMSKLQHIMAGGIPLGYIVNLGAQTGGGKCLGYGTKVMMSDMSIKEVQDIVVGDKLMGDDGSPRKVLSVCKGVEQLYRVDQNRGMSYVVNESHILSLRNSYSNGRGKVGEIVDINILDYIDSSDKLKHQLKGYIGNFTELGKDSKPVKDPYILGVWLADGHSDGARITIGSDDSDVANEVLKWAADNNYGVSSPPSSMRVTSTAYSISGGMRTWLKSHNLLGNKHIPNEYLLASYNDRMDLLAGILDCDGYLHRNAYDLVLKVGELPQDVVKLARSLGFRVTVKECKKSCQNNFTGDYIRIYISGDISRIPMRNKRKYSKCENKVHTGLNTGITVTPLDEGDYYGFEIDGNRRFCLEDGTVTHNTTIINEMVYHWIFNSPYKIGIMSLELNAGQYQLSILSRHIGTKIQLMEDPKVAIDFINQPWVIEKRKELRETEYGEERYTILDERDGNLDSVKKQIDKLVKKHNCKLIVIDPINDLFEGCTLEQQTSFVKYLKQIVKDGISIFNVCHITKGKTEIDKSTGKRKVRQLTEDDFAGVSNIVKSGGCNILAVRDKTADTEIERNTTIVEVPKCRWTGRSGIAGEWFYCNNTHTIYDLQQYLSNMYKPDEHANEPEQVETKSIVNDIPEEFGF